MCTIRNATLHAPLRKRSPWPPRRGAQQLARKLCGRATPRGTTIGPQALWACRAAGHNNWPASFVGVPRGGAQQLARRLCGRAAPRGTTIGPQALLVCRAAGHNNWPAGFAGAPRHAASLQKEPPAAPPATHLPALQRAPNYLPRTCQHHHAPPTTGHAPVSTATRPWLPACSSSSTSRTASSAAAPGGARPAASGVVGDGRPSLAVAAAAALAWLPATREITLVAASRPPAASTASAAAALPLPAMPTRHSSASATPSAAAAAAA
eukprot:119771-Chlamydomonas_euryale.AAC.2